MPTSPVSVSQTSKKGSINALRILIYSLISAEPLRRYQDFRHCNRKPECGVVINSCSMILETSLSEQRARRHYSCPSCQHKFLAASANHSYRNGGGSFRFHYHTARRNENRHHSNEINMKVLLLMLTMALIGGACFSQNNYHGFDGFWEHLPRYASAKQFRNMKATTLLPDSTYRGFRPLGSLVVQAYPGGSTLAGLGFGYEKSTYTVSTQSWYTNISVGLLIYAGGTIAPTNPNAVIAAGPNLSILNKRISIGGAWDFVNKRPLLTFGTTLSFVSN